MAIDEHKNKNGNWKKLIISILENNVNVQKQPMEVFYEKAVFKNIAIFIGKHLCWSLFLIKLFLFINTTKFRFCVTQTFFPFINVCIFDFCKYMNPCLYILFLVEKSMT